MRCAEKITTNHQTLKLQLSSQIVALVFTYSALTTDRFFFVVSPVVSFIIFLQKAFVF